MTESVELALYFLLVGILFLGSGFAFYNGKVSRNSTFGARTNKALSSDEAWYAINRYMGKHCLIWSVPHIVIGILYIAYPMLLSYKLILFTSLSIFFIPIIKTAIFNKNFDSDV